jgi:SPP1 gp7 family putative phage head morphogenesis protein
MNTSTVELREIYVPNGYTLVKDEALDTMLLNSLQKSDVVMTINNSVDANAKLFQKVMNGLKDDIDWMESNSKNITEFKEKIDLYTKVNPMTTESNMGNLMDAIKSITKEFDVNAKGLPVGGTKELVKNVIWDRSFTDMKDIGESVNVNIKQILEQSINNEQGMRYARDEMNKKIDGMSRNSAERNARTETVYARNQAELLKAQDAGKEYFIVISADDCCEDCFDAYDGNVFHLPEDEAMLPPFHYNCRCTASFFKSESNAESMADDISKPRDEG